MAIIVILVLLAIVLGFFVIRAGQVPSALSPNQLSQNQAKAREAEKSRDEFLEVTFQDAQSFRATHLTDPPETCEFAINEASSSLEMVFYTLRGGFHVRENLTLSKDEIVSVEVRRPREIKQVKEVDHVPVVTSAKKSPIARGLAGGILLGPAGLMLGAASGLSPEIKTKIEKRYKSVNMEVEGDPIMFLTTKLTENPLLVIKMHDIGKTEFIKAKISRLL